MIHQNFYALNFKFIDIDQKLKRMPIGLNHQSRFYFVNLNYLSINYIKSSGFLE